MSSTCVLVLGMHRSGTSALTRCLNLLGMDLGASLIAPEAMNSKGFWEHADAVRINSELLQSFGMYWRSLGPLPENWLVSDAAARAKEEIALLVRRDFSSIPLWGIKDPRMCRLAPLWLEVLGELGVVTTAAITLRSPLEVAASLAKAHSQLSDVQSNVFSWMQHVAESEVATRGLTRTMIEYDDLMADPEAALADIGDSLNIGWPISIADRREAIRSFLDVGMRTHHKGKDIQPVPPLARRIADECAAVARDKGRGDWSRLSAVADEVVETTHLIGSVEGMYRDIANQTMARSVLYFAANDLPFSEGSSIVRSVPYGRSQLEFWLPHYGSKPLRFRLDPIDRRSCCVVRSVVLMDGGGNVTWDLAQSQEDVECTGLQCLPSLVNEGQRLFVTSDDPHLVFNWPASLALEGSRLQIDIERLSDAELCLELKAAVGVQQEADSVWSHTCSQALSVEPDFKGGVRGELKAQRSELVSLESQLQTIVEGVRHNDQQQLNGWSKLNDLIQEIRDERIERERRQLEHQARLDELVLQCQRAESELALNRSDVERLNEHQAEQAVALQRIQKHWPWRILVPAKK
jgi:hypothetical protein